MNFDSFREIKIDETEEFKSFAEEIDCLIEFFKSFSELIFINGRIISFFLDPKVFYLNTYLIDSDYVHNNGVRFAAQNSVRKNDVNLEIHLKNINIRTSHIASFFIIVLLMIDSALIASSDYMDHINCDLRPPEDSQYLVAGFIQDFIDSKVSKLHPELKQYLIDNNINGMKIE